MHITIRKWIVLWRRCLKNLVISDMKATDCSLTSSLLSLLSSHRNAWYTRGRRAQGSFIQTTHALCLDVTVTLSLANTNISSCVNTLMSLSALEVDMWRKFRATPELQRIQELGIGFTKVKTINMMIYRSFVPMCQQHQ